ncbi:rhodanese-like domain-containing protein [Cryomorphaceae bacterium 1068]|nr:rhodanese-like domain-containing protein [Cryomorphaceae bacterium 1068]
MSIFSFTKKSLTDLSAEDFKSNMDKDPKAQLLDVRTSGEVAEGKIGDAKNIDFFSPNFRDEVKKLSKDKNYYVYCRSGNRSGQAVRFMEGEGFTAFNLKGGVMSWPY